MKTNKINNNEYKLYRIKVRMYNSNAYKYLAYPNRAWYDFGFYGRVSKSQAIIVSETSLQRDILQLYLAYHDNIIEEVDDGEDIKERLLYLNLEDFGDENDLYNKQRTNGYCIQPSENDYLYGYFNNVKLYKLQNKKTGNWLSYDFMDSVQIDMAMIFSEYCIKYNDFIEKYKSEYNIVHIDKPLRFTHIFYSIEDIVIYMR